MMKKFVRQNNESLDKVKEAYKTMISHASDNANNKSLNDEERRCLIEEEYEKIAAPIIERNELFFEALVFEKKRILSTPNESRGTLVEDFIYLINMLRRNQILNQVDSTDLKDFHETPTLRVLTIDDFLNFFDEADSEALYSCLQAKFETHVSLANKNKAFGIIDEIVGAIDFQKFQPNLQVKRVYYGSTASKLSTSTSDIDITLLTTTSNCDERELLKYVQEVIQRQNLLGEYEHKVTALVNNNIRVPILDYELSTTTISFSVNNKLAVINSRLLEIYSNLDPRCRMLALLIKVWSKTHNICSAKEGYLSSYAYNLMVINFLQIHQPPILPSLQKLRAEDNEVEPSFVKIIPPFNYEAYKVRVDFEDDIVKVQEYMRKTFDRNERTLKDLLQRFFQFYGNRKNFEKRILSVKDGKRLERGFLDADEFYLYSIQDPFEKYQNPGRYVSKSSRQANRILDVMKKSYKLMKEGKLINLFEKFDI